MNCAQKIFPMMVACIAILAGDCLAQGNLGVDRFPPTGGMWLPSQMPELEAQLRSLGIEIDPGQLADPASNTLNAIVSLGGCSGSFVSDNGTTPRNGD